MHHFDWKRGIGLGAAAGIIWSWIAMALNIMSGVFQFENSIFYNLIAFSVLGAVIGIVAGGFMIVMQERLPFRRPFPKAVLLSTSIWLVLRTGGYFLSLNDPVRYHPAANETLQGFVLAVILGCVLGSLWEIQKRTGH